MFWTTGFVLLALTIGQVPAWLVKPGVNEDAITGTATVITDTVSESAVSDRISSGWEAYPGQFPYAVSLRAFDSGGGVRECGGSVVHNNWVISTAYCVVNRRSAVVRAGVTDITTTPEYMFETTEMWVHPGFDVNRPNTIQGDDISILKVNHITYTRMIQPIRIQSSVDAFRNYANEKVIASGWGSLTGVGEFPAVLNWVYLRAISNQDCVAEYGTNIVMDTTICTMGYNASSQAPCSGDLGGPLVHVGHDGEPVLVGLASYIARGGCQMGRPSGFVRPGPYHSWLTERTGLNFDEVTEPPTTKVTEPTTEVTEPPTTKVTEPTTEVTEPPTTEDPKPPTTETPMPPTSEEPKPLTTEEPKPPTTEMPKPPITEAPKPGSQESDENFNDSDGSESKEDPDVSQLLNKLQVKVKVKVKVNNNVNSKVK